MKDDLVWQERFNIGVEHLDKEHRRLFSTMKRLLEFTEHETKRQWACKEGVKYLKNHTAQHFRDEEEYMRSIHYGDYEIHKRLHDSFAQKTLPALEKELEETNYSVDSVRHFLGVCIGWMTGHTLIEDQAITGKTASKWSDLPHEEDIAAMEQAIVQLVNDMFRVDAKVLSEHYSGEDFGKGICCRFVYRTKEGERWEIIFVWEESILLKTVGTMMSIQLSKVDDMVINATRYMARQFLGRISTIFPTIDLHELDRECLLTQEQLSQAFEKEQPHFSLLFDMGEGYFAFCATSSKAIKGKIGTAIKHENAMNEIQDYLLKSDLRKKKILVVDDSDVARCGIMNLLEEDYLLSGAATVVSAFKSIVKDKPDLILLDYEMPICDGRQMLAMLRAEKDLADIPVVFLTGRGDKDSVSKVMSLKPAGYLLKTMPRDAIKKNIDSFFEKAEANEVKKNMGWGI